jgi:hypothetical protein
MNDSIKITSLNAHSVQPNTRAPESPEILATVYGICTTAIQQLVVQIRQEANAQPETDIGHDMQFWLMQFDALVEHSTHNRLLAARLYYTLLSQHLPASLHRQSANDQWQQLGCYLNTAADIKADNLSIAIKITPNL